MIHHLNGNSVIAAFAIAAPGINQWERVNTNVFVPALSFFGIVYLGLQIYFILKNKGKR